MVLIRRVTVFTIFGAWENMMQGIEENNFFLWQSILLHHVMDFWSSHKHHCVSVQEGDLLSLQTMVESLISINHCVLYQLLHYLSSQMSKSARPSGLIRSIYIWSCTGLVIRSYVIKAVQTSFSVSYGNTFGLGISYFTLALWKDGHFALF